MRNLVLIPKNSDNNLENKTVELMSIMVIHPNHLGLKELSMQKTID